MKTNNVITKKEGSCPQCLKHSFCRRGFVILFAVTLSAILLTIAVGVANIALREVKFSTNARNTNDAFFAADVGIECAEYYDRTPPDNSFIGTSPIQMNCAGNDDIVIKNVISNKWTFAVSGLGSTGKGCAEVIVDKTGSCGTASFPDCVISKGYNNATVATNSDQCDFSSNAVEREIKVIY